MTKREGARDTFRLKKFIPFKGNLILFFLHEILWFYEHFPGCNLPSRAFAAKLLTSDEICAKPYEHFKIFDK